MPNIHVVPKGDNWAVEHSGGGQGKTYPTQEEAVRVGTEQAKREKVELLIHGRDGQIRERNSFGNDPRDIPG